MKILIVAGTNLRYCPYVDFYVDVFKSNRVDFDVLYPNRTGIDDSRDYNTIVYDWNRNVSKYIELYNFRKYIINTISKDQYNCVILLTTVLSVLMANYLKKKNIDYIVDIRDYTYEHIRPFYWVECEAINNAICCVISSPSFREFLPAYDYIDVYNASGTLTSKNSGFRKSNQNRPIRISYIGTIAYHDQCKRLMNLVEKDSRFVFDLYGNDLHGDEIETYISSQGYARSRYHGPYRAKEKGSIIEMSDILFNAYGNNSPLLLYALSNKLTDSVVYNKPVLNSPDTSMHEILSYCSYAINFEDTYDLDGLYQWFDELDEYEINSNSAMLRERINNTNRIAEIEILKAIAGSNA